MPARLALLSLAVISLACGQGNADSASIAVNEHHVDLFVDLQLAGARSELTGESLDSLRAEVLSAHSVDQVGLDQLVRRYADRPEEAVALLRDVEETLSSELSNP